MDGSGPLLAPLLTWLLSVSLDISKCLVETKTVEMQTKNIFHQSVTPVLEKVPQSCKAHISLLDRALTSPPWRCHFAKY